MQQKGSIHHHCKTCGKLEEEKRLFYNKNTVSPVYNRISIIISTRVSPATRQALGDAKLMRPRKDISTNMFEISL